MTHILPGLLGLALLALAAAPSAAEPARFVAAWTGSVQGPYPVGNPTAQPDLRFALHDPARGASNQSFRLIVRPDIWGNQTRIRLSNAFGTRPVTFEAVHIGLQLSGSALVHGTNRPVTFAGKHSVTVAPGAHVLSDPVSLPFVPNPNLTLLAGRRLAISFHVAGESGPMTWHAKALTTSYIAPPGTPPRGAEEAETGFPFSTTSWYFLDAVEMSAPPGTKAVVALGDSITDGTASTLNGDDRWPDVFARRLHGIYGQRFAVVNAGIGGNQVTGPAEYGPARPANGGPSALARLERDVISLGQVGAVIWLEGINDLGTGGASAAAVEAGVREGVKRLRARIPGVRIFMATLTSALHSTPSHGTPEVEARRQAYNRFIRTTDIFDGVLDFDAITIDPATGELKPEFQPNSSTGGPGDKLHPNRAGYLVMGHAIEPKTIVGK